jgi:hypothetical protein
VEVVTFGKILGNFSPIFPPSAAGFASVASDAGDLLWRKLERSKITGSPPSWGFDVPLATALCKTFLLRMLNDSWAGRNTTRVVVPIEEGVYGKMLNLGLIKHFSHNSNGMCAYTWAETSLIVLIPVLLVLFVMSLGVVRACVWSA